MPNWIVELEPGVYLAATHGDPGRTLQPENAEPFASRPRAAYALRDARQFRPFDHGRVTLKPEYNEQAEGGAERAMARRQAGGG